MAKTSTIVKEHQKAIAVKRKAAKREKLKKENDQEGLQKLSRRTSKTQLRNRCRKCGRPRGFYRKFGLCREHLREAMLRGDVPGGVFSSW